MTVRQGHERAWEAMGPVHWKPLMLLVLASFVGRKWSRGVRTLLLRPFRLGSKGWVCGDDPGEAKRSGRSISSEASLCARHVDHAHAHARSDPQWRWCKCKALFLCQGAFLFGSLLGVGVWWGLQLQTPRAANSKPDTDTDTDIGSRCFCLLVASARGDTRYVLLLPGTMAEVAGGLLGVWFSALNSQGWSRSRICGCLHSRRFVLKLK